MISTLERIKNEFIEEWLHEHGRIDKYELDILNRYTILVYARLEEIDGTQQMAD